MSQEGMYTELSKERPRLLRAMYGVPRAGPLPPIEDFCARVSPRPEAWGGVGLDVLAWQGSVLGIAEPVVASPDPQPLRLHRPTIFGWLLLAGLLICLRPVHRMFFATWALATFGYLFGVFMTGNTNTRYFAPAVAFLLILAIMPLDAIFGWVARRARGDSLGRSTGECRCPPHP